MTDRRSFIQTVLTVASGMAIGQSITACAVPETSWPSGIIYTPKNPGQWAQKIAGHAPKVSVQGKKVTITTDHVMTEKHYIVRQTLVSSDGKVLGAETFYPEDEEAVSTFELSDGHTSKLYATSFCNKHDLWVVEFTV